MENFQRETILTYSDKIPATVPDLFDLKPLTWLYYLEKVINTRSFNQ